MISINGVEISTPKSFSLDIMDIDGETNRNLNGDLLRDRIATKRKIECEWPPLTQSEMSILLKAVSDVFFEVTFPDPQEGMCTKTMYVGDRNAPAYFYNTKTKQVEWNGLKMNFIER